MMSYAESWQRIRRLFGIVELICISGGALCSSLINISLVFSGNYHKTFCAFRFTASLEEALAGEENITDGLPKL
jgi:hypothetical protein